MFRPFAALIVALAALPAAAAAQDAGEPGVTSDAADAQEKAVFEGDFISLGIGAGLGPSYTGSDDYTVFPLPIVQGSLGGVRINPRPAGLALDFLADAKDSTTSFSLGPVIKLNRDRASQIEDEIVAAYGKLDTAVEVGPSVGVSFSGVLNRFDSVSVNVDAVWDVAGAHKGMTVSPSVTYFTPLSRGTAVSLSASTTWVDDDYADYYYSVPATNPALAPADQLPGFVAGGGFESVGVNLLVAHDLGGDLTDGGLSLVAIGGYSRLLGDARDTPFTAIRGSADQFLLGLGIGYTF